MCGLAGFYLSSSLGAEASAAALQAAGDSLRHRGPDSEGFFHDKAGLFHVVHRRLAIQDLSPAGHQPMVSACQNWVLAFNGEIYNHLEIRAELEQQAPVQWRGHSDTETLLVAFMRWGFKQTLVKAVGMFAIALWHTPSQTLRLARDRFGEKPLYYGIANSSVGPFNHALVFSSELKAIRALPGFKNPINQFALGEYFKNLYVPAPLSIYSGIHKLEPGCYLEVDCSKKEHLHSFTQTAYWRYAELVERSSSNLFSSEDEAITEVERVLEQAVSDQCLADVPLGAFLSGGVDSSAIVALMQKNASKPVSTFTVGFDVEGYDESAHAKAVAAHLGTAHNELRVTSQDAMDVIPKLSSMYCEPFADSSQIPTYLVCKSARQNSTVALSGDAGDEMFGGYNRYFWGPKVWNKAGKLGWVGRNAAALAIETFSPAAWDKMAGLLNSSSGVAGSADSVVRVGEKLHKLASRMKNTESLDDFYFSLISEWRRPQELLIDPRYEAQLDYKPAEMPMIGAKDAVARMMYRDAMGYLPGDILAKVDRASMAISLETRAPFLDHRVAEVAWRLPMNMKIRNGVGKWALRQVLYKYVPKELIERPKAGFAVPLHQWLKGPLRDWAERLLSTPALQSSGYLNASVVQTIWRQHLSGRYDHTAKLWSVLMFQAWLAEQNSTLR